MRETQVNCVTRQKPSLKYHLQLKTKEDVGGSGLGLQGGRRKWSLCACVLSCFSCVRFFVTLWTVARQASLSMGFSRQEYWSGLSFPSLGNLPKPRIKPGLPHFRQVLLGLSHQGRKLSSNFCLF